MNGFVCIVVACVLVQTIAFKARLSFSGRIRGGDDAEIGDFPYQLSIQSNAVHFCGASLLSSTKAVTAAHCSQIFPIDAFTLRAGSSIVNIGGELVSVSVINQHPNYNPSTIEYDVSVLTLSEPLPLGSFINVVPLQPFNEEPTLGSKAIVTGWGEIDTNGNFPLKLQKLELKYSSSNCIYRSLNEPNGCFLAEPGKGVCWGDSGGPIVSGGKLVGIVSLGYACALHEYPLVYASIWNPQIHNFITINLN